jgi:hypothetical protein
MVDLISRLNEVEKQYPDFFEKKGKSISEYITAGMYQSGIFINGELPVEIIDKIRKIFSEITFPKD